MHPASSERLHATVRSRLASPVRRPRAGARRYRMEALGMNLVGTVDPCRTPHATLTNTQGHRCAPTMAIGLTHHVWTGAAWRHVHGPPARWQPPDQRGRRSNELHQVIEYGPHITVSQARILCDGTMQNQYFQTIDHRS